VPSYGVWIVGRRGFAEGRVDGSFLLEFLQVVFAEVEVGVWRAVEGEDVVDGFELGDGYETDLEKVSGGCCVGTEMIA
jgi:hypothetical protein